MKKFLLSLLAFAAAILLGYYLIYFAGVFLPLQEDPVVLFRTEGMEYQRLTEDGTYETMIFQGVDLSASMPGFEATQFAVSEEKYLSWLTQIADMGANLVRVTTVMNDAFYNAFYTYNMTHSEPLYLLQGSSVSDSANAGAQDCYATDFYDALLEDGRTLVDIIHGRKNIILSTARGSGRYRKDISPWVVGWLVGNEWNPGTVSYSDHRVIPNEGFSGTYFTTSEEASRFETMLAQIMDAITRYEVVKYGVQRPIGFANAPNTDFLEFKEVYGRQLEKYCYIDSEHILATDAMVAGQYAAYSLYDFCEDYGLCLSLKQKGELLDVLREISTDDLYGGYMDILAYHHTMPLVVTGYGFSTGRNPDRLDVEPITEQEQGERLMAVYEESLESGWSGVCISTWQDSWERTSWNNVFSVDATTNNLWHDLQGANQNYGLLAFSPEEIVCTLDGNLSEWSEDDVILTMDGISMSIRSDTEGIYLMLSGITKAQQLYIPVDVSPVVGSFACAEPKLRFSRASEFLLCLEGTSNTRLLVQDRYDARRANFGQACDLVDPYIFAPEADSESFQNVTIAVRNPYLLSEEQWLFSPVEDRQQLQAMGTYETGRLVHGSQDRESSIYTSQADFCYGDGCVEIRLPWNMLNVGNPADREIHCDYYEHYGVTLERSKGIWFGLMDAMGNSSEMSQFQWDGWNTMKFSERLKDSYYVIRQIWR